MVFPLKSPDAERKSGIAAAVETPAPTAHAYVNTIEFKNKSNGYDSPDTTTIRFAVRRRVTT